MKNIKKNDIFDISLDEEEEMISKAFDKRVLQNIPNLTEELLRARVAAGNTLRKNARVNIRISSNDLTRLKQKAAYKGLPYQTFIASVLHEYAAGHFKEVA